MRYEDLLEKVMDQWIEAQMFGTPEQFGALMADATITFEPPFFPKNNPLNDDINERNRRRQTARSVILSLEGGRDLLRREDQR